MWFEDITKLSFVIGSKPLDITVDIRGENLRSSGELNA